MSIFSTNFDHRYWMKSGHFFCGLNTPNALISDGNQTHGLPPYSKRQGFLVDEYPGCPDNWMRSHGKTTSWFVGVPDGAGMWLDFNKNWDSEYDIAIVISVQGVNPITGMPCTDAQLEQYIEKCPKCDKEFGPERYCEKCGFHWPKQNYLSTTAQPYGFLWLDGFRTAEGIVRQYILTEEKLRSVAGHIVGKDRVYAVGISFFLSKERRRQPIVNPRQFFSPTYSATTWHNCVNDGNKKYFAEPLGVNHHIKYSYDVNEIQVRCASLDKETSSGAVNTLSGNTGEAFAKSGSIVLSRDTVGKRTKKLFGSTRLGTSATHKPIQTKKLEVGAGESIDQQVYDDPEPLDFWRKEPESILCINYCTEIDAQKILDAGRVPIEAEPEGFLQNIPVGNVKQEETA